MPGVKIWGCQTPATGVTWVPIKVNSDGTLVIDVTPGVKTATKILDVASLAAVTTTALGVCTAINLSSGAWTLAITVEATYNVAATQGIKVHVRTSYDGTNYDTVDWDSWVAAFTANTSIRQTKHYDTDPVYIKILIENLAAVAVTGIKVYAAVGA